MQKFSVLRYWFSEIQRFFSTNSRCMIAICPAGPPKLMNPSFTQNRNASPKRTGLFPASLFLVASASISTFYTDQLDKRTRITLRDAASQDTSEIFWVSENNLWRKLGHSTGPLRIVLPLHMGFL